MEKERLKKEFNIYSNKFFEYLNWVDRTKATFGFFWLFAFVILFNSFKYTVIDSSYYKKLAEKQQIIEIKNPVTRWWIYSNNTPAWVFATSTNLTNLAIDPQEEWDKQKLEDFLVEVTFEQFCIKKEEDVCQENVTSFVKKYEIEDFVYEENYIKNLLREEIKNKINKKTLDSVIIKDNLEQKNVDEIKAMNIQWLYFITNNLYADPTKIVDKIWATNYLGEKLWISKDELDNKLKLRPIRYVSIVKRLNIDLKDNIEKRIDSESQSVKNKLVDVKNSIYRFLILESEPTRYYPENKLGSQITWFVTPWNNWKYWIEWYFNDQLKWEDWVKITKKDVSGKMLGWSDLWEKDSINWADIKLTIDRNIQKEVTKILQDWVKEYKANKASAIIMDPKTWAIIAMADSYEYDPNSYWDVYALEKVSYAKYPNPWFDLLGMPVFVEDSINWEIYRFKWQEVKLRLASSSELWNTAIPKYKFKNNFWPWAYNNDSIWSLYEPGSVFKAFTTAIWIDSWDIKPTDTYTDKWYVEIDKFKIKNLSDKCTGHHTYLHALNWSCNVWMIDIVRKVWKPMFYKYLNDFWIWQKTNITLEWEVYSQIPPYEKWSQAKLFTMSFGQWVTATLIQMATAYSVLANWWLYMQPYIVDTMNLPNWTQIKNEPKVLRRVIKEDTSKKIIGMLVEWVRNWFAAKWWVEWYDVAWKTWTSQIASKGWYEIWAAWHTITSYGWFAPASNPKFVIIVRVERPRSAQYSETTSSVLFQKITKYLLNYYSIPKNN